MRAVRLRKCTFLRDTPKFVILVKNRPAVVGPFFKGESCRLPAETVGVLKKWGVVRENSR